MLTPETVLQSRYRVVRQLGQGGMGAVYEAVDERLDSTIALKETFFADERLRKQFEREARLLARMHHPALPRVSDHFSEGDGQFLVMHFIDGDDLAAMSAKRGGPFPTEQVLTWADQLLDALDYLHTQDPQIIHRDIKPQNLKLTPRGQIILLDFGLAKGQAAEVSRATTTASIFGYTPNYAPLEQIQGLGTDARSDLYALAATLYHLITGVKPPDALSRAAAIVNGQPDPLKPAHEVNISVPPQTAAVLQKAMAQNRDQRYATAAEMRKALLGADSETTVANRTEADTVLFAAAAPPVAAETIASVPQTTLLSSETTVVHSPGGAPRKPWVIAAAAVVLLVGVVGVFYAYQRRSNSANLASPAINQVSTPAVEGEPPGGGSAVSTETPHETKQVTDDKRQVATEEKVVRKQEKATKQSVSDRQQADRDAAEEADRARAERQSRELPETPDEDVQDPPRTGQPPPRRRVGNVVIRNMPDGSQVIVGQDGSRVRVAPDGTTQVIRAPQRANRRRMPRRPY
ncbi:MAG: serine/threonine protein kinase [Pyrinomonadaceae bacterium]|nr:serine/threonine protein kinase [Pyrinomonadaceae bacterium]